MVVDVIGSSTWADLLGVTRGFFAVDALMPKGPKAWKGRFAGFHMTGIEDWGTASFDW